MVVQFNHLSFKMPRIEADGVLSYLYNICGFGDSETVKFWEIQRVTEGNPAILAHRGLFGFCLPLLFFLLP